MEVSHYSNCLQMNEIRFRKFVLFAYWRSYRIDLKHVKSHAGIWLTTNEEGKWERERQRERAKKRLNKKIALAASTHLISILSVVYA